MTPNSDSTGRHGIHIAGAAFEAIGFAFREQSTSDFGIDAHAEFRTGCGGTGQLLALQVKSGESYFREPAENGWWLRTDIPHAEYWLKHALPVVIIQVDVPERHVYWAAVTERSVEFTEKGAKILIPSDQQVDVDSLPTIRALLAATRDLGEAAAEGGNCRVYLGRGISGRASWHRFASVLIRQIIEMGCVTDWNILVQARTATEDADLTDTNEFDALGEDLVYVEIDKQHRLATYSVSARAVEDMDLDGDEYPCAEAAADAIVERLMAADGLIDDEINDLIDDE